MCVYAERGLQQRKRFKGKSVLKEISVKYSSYIRVPNQERIPKEFTVIEWKQRRMIVLNVTGEGGKGGESECFKTKHGSKGWILMLTGDRLKCEAWR